MAKAKLKTVDRPTSVSREAVRAVVESTAKTGANTVKLAAGSALSQKVPKKK